MLSNQPLNHIRDSNKCLKALFSLCQRTPLHIAAGEGYGYTVENLLRKGADIHIKDKQGVNVTILLMMLFLGFIHTTWNYAIF